MRAILREVAKCRALLGQIGDRLVGLVESLDAIVVGTVGCLDAIGVRLDGIDAKLAELIEGPDQEPAADGAPTP